MVDLCGNSSLSFHVGADILNLLLLFELFMFFHVLQVLRFHKTMLFSPLRKFILSVRLSIKTCGLEVLMFSEFINMVSILYFY